MYDSEFRPSQVWGVLVRDWKVDFISDSNLNPAIEMISRACLGLADERRPTCLAPVGLEDKPPFAPIDCGRRANRGSHSIQRNGPLADIAISRGSGPSVLRFFPNVQQLMNLTRGVRNRPATKWLWEVESIPPREVPISEASIGHFACEIHDKEPFLGLADNLRLPPISEHVSFDDRRPSPEFKEVSDPLFYLAYRTLLFRISQFRGTEKEAMRFLLLQMLSNNRYGVQSCHEALLDLSSTLTELLRFKSSFDRRIMGDTSAIHLVHHIVPFQPVIPYVASEYMPLKHLTYRDEDYIWVSLNILSLQGRNYLVLSHLAFNNPHRDSIIRRSIFDFVYGSEPDRRRADYDVFINWTNVYASIKDYLSLEESDRTFIGSRIAWNICEEPFAKGLEILRSSPGGAREISRAETELRNQP